MTPVDILYLAKGRDEFTEASLQALDANTNWSLLNGGGVFGQSDGGKFYAYTDGAPVHDYLSLGMDLRDCHIDAGVYGGPVAIMNDFLSKPGAPLFAKIDNDVIVPPGWLDAAMKVMEDNPRLDFLGLEPPASRTPNPATPGRRIQAPELMGATGGFTHSRDLHFGYAPTDCVGGVGLFRRRAFEGKIKLQAYGFNGVGGFTSWQQAHNIVAGWIVPPLKLFLLDRLPFDPWLSLSKRYIDEGLQRPWTNYPETAGPDLWDWWKR